MRERADAVEELYRGFLFLNLKYPGKSIVPTVEVDEFWHQHILDTRKYADDCGIVFGSFLHHFPYFGMRGEGDARALQAAFAETNSLFVKELGMTPSVMGSDCSDCDASACDDPPDCGSSCRRADRMLGGDTPALRRLIR